MDTSSPQKSMDNEGRIVIVGSHAPGLFIRVRRVPQPGETVLGWDFQEPMDGGKGSNQAIATARLGHPVSFVGCVGNDRIGNDGEMWMRQDGVDTRFLQRSKRLSSGVGFILLDEQGVPAMVTSLGANAELSQEYVEHSLNMLRGARVLLTQFEILPEVALHAAEVAHRLGMTTIVNPAPAIAQPPGAFCDADILVPNEAEARLLLGLDPQVEVEPSDLVHMLFRVSGAACVIVTLGEQGVVGMNRTDEWEVKPPRVNTVDTSGAGDIFCAALAVGIVDGFPVQSACDWACQVAALSVTRPGTIPSYPTLEEVRTFVNKVRRNNIGQGSGLPNNR